MMNFEREVLQKFLGEQNAKRVLQAIEQGDTVENIVFKTVEYGKFNKLEANRNTIPKHVESLMESMRNKLLPTYIMIDENYGLADGQNRKEALEALGFPISYYFADGITPADLATLQNGEAWSKDSYLESNIKMGNENYIFFKEMAEESGVTTERLLKIFTYAQKIKHNDMERRFMNGKFTLDNVNGVIDFLVALNDFKPYCEQYNSNPFVIAFLKLFFRDSYNHDVMKKNLTNKKYASNLKHQFNTYSDYLHVLTMLIYNKGTASMKGFTPIVYDKDNDEFTLG